MNFKGNPAQQTAEQEQRHVTAKQNMADAQQFTKSRNLIRIERMFIFKQKIWIKVQSQSSAEKDFTATLPQTRRFLTELFK